MLKYLIKRIFIFIPTIIAITLISFIISLNAPGDPVEVMLTGGSGDQQEADRVSLEKQYLEKKIELGLHLPIFYFSLSNLAEPDTLYRIIKIKDQKAVTRLTNEYGNWPQIQDYHHSVIDLERKIFALKDGPEIKEHLNNMKNIAKFQRETYETDDIERNFNSMDTLLDHIEDIVVGHERDIAAKGLRKDSLAAAYAAADSRFHAYQSASSRFSELNKKIQKDSASIAYNLITDQEELKAAKKQLKAYQKERDQLADSVAYFAAVTIVRDSLEGVLNLVQNTELQMKQLEIIDRHLTVAKANFKTVQDEAEVWKTFVPAINFYGFDNQYHRWLKKILVFDFGVSYQDKRPISSKLPEAIRWSFFINIFSIFLAYLGSVFIGVYSATHKDTASDKFLTTLLFILYSLPSFWVATMLINFLANPEYLFLFPNNGVQDTLHSAEWPFMKRLGDWAYHLILPVFCYTYGSFAFLSRQMRVGMLEVINQDFIRTARAKGLNERKVIWKHAFRNSLIPIITLFAQIFPSMIGGSIILEKIFSIPGMGFITINAIYARDYPVIISIFTLAGILTLVGILFADIMYAVVDPRISYSKK